MELTFNLTGFGLAMICLVIIAIQVVTNRFVKKVTNTYWFWLAIGLFCLIWLLYFRFIPAWKNYAEAKSTLDGRFYSDANVISKAFFLDICPFMGLFMTVSVIVDPTRKLARAAAPLSLIGGILIVMIQMPFESVGSSTSPLWSLKWIFLGEDPNPCYFFLHAVNLFIAVGVMLNTPRYGWKGYLSTVIIAVLYYSYVAIMMKVKNCQWFVSGLNLNDWSSEGEYHAVAELLKCSPAVAAGVGFPFCYCVCSGFIALNDYVFKNGWWRYGNAYSGRWWAWYNYQRFVVQKIL